MEEIRKLLSSPLDHENGHVLRGQLAVLAAYQALASTECRKAESELSRVRGKLYNPSLQTELYRKVDLERATASNQQYFEEWSDLSKILKDQISLGQSFLRSIQGEMESGLR